MLRRFLPAWGNWLGDPYVCLPAASLLMVVWSWWATEISAVPAWNPYIVAIRDVQPQGPYRLAGWSAGGTIAFEIARQLLAADAEVEFLGMIDTDADYRSLFESESTGALVVNPAAEFDRIDALLMLLPSSAPPAVRDEVSGLARARDFQRMIEVFQARSYVPAGVEGEGHVTLPKLPNVLLAFDSAGICINRRIQ